MDCTRIYAHSRIVADELIVDTGSSNTWVGANTEYTPTDTSEDTGDSVVSAFAI